MINNIPLIAFLLFFSLSAKPDIQILSSDNNSKYSGRAVIIIDDLGNQYKPCLPLIRSKYPITLSILPACPFSRKIAEEGHVLGHEIILHAPMESWDNASNRRELKFDNRFLTTAMEPEELTVVLESMIRSIPHIMGISNHMGSKFTEDSIKMEVVIRALKDKKLCFVDSRTSKDSKGFMLANKHGVASVERQIFLDNDQTYEGTVDQLSNLMRMGNKKGYAVGIGHPYPTTIRALLDMMPNFKENNVEIVPLSEMLD